MRSTFSELTAEVYELGNPIEAFRPDAKYHQKTLADVSGRVLDLACGTGRILIPLLEAGINTEGLDHSPAMLSICENRARERELNPILHTGDMVAFEFPEAYEAIVIAAGAIKELDGRDAVLQALSCCKKALVSGGKLIVDLVPPRLTSLAISADRPTTFAPMRFWRRDSFVWTVETVVLEYDSTVDRTTALRRYEKWHL
jgi:ubiquinone/menaquinone biosynthesis C-methylase UbiE